MAHTPVNHPLRPLYRVVGGLTGIYLVVFGIAGLIVTGGEAPFADNTDKILGQGGNFAWSIASLVLGALVVLGAVLGRNIDAAIDTYLGWGLLVLGSFELAVSRTDITLFNFSVATVVVTYLVGLALIVVSLYAKVAPRAAAPVAGPQRERQAA